MDMNEKEFDSIYKQYYQPLFAYCYRKIPNAGDAGSIVDDALLLLYRKWDSLSFPNQKAIYSWLMEVIKKKILEYYRQNAKHFVIESLDEHENDLIDPEAQEWIIHSQAKIYEDSLQKIKLRLRKKDAELFDLLVIREVKQEEAAIQLGIKTGALKMRWNRLKPQIRLIIRQLKANGDL